VATAAQVCKSILQKILVQDVEAPLDASEYQDTIFTMNNYMLDLDASGVTLGYTEVTNLSDEVTVPTGALRGVIYNVALEMAPEFDVPVTPALAAIASASMKTMMKLGVTLSQSAYPCTLPRGSGNEGFVYRNSHFFPGEEARILAETTGAIGLETSTNEVADNG